MQVLAIGRIVTTCISIISSNALGEEALEAKIERLVSYSYGDITNIHEDNPIALAQIKYSLDVSFPQYDGLVQEW